MEAATPQDLRSGTDPVALVPFAPAHRDGALALSREMAWPYRIEDWDFALGLGRGFVLERDGAVIGTAACFPTGEGHATVGMIIVAKAAQGRGYGTRLMQALLREAGPRSILLNSTAEGRALYERYGFVPVGTLLQHQGPYTARAAFVPDDRVRAVVPADRDAVLRLDTAATGLDRRHLVARLIAAGEGHVLLREGVPVGYAITRLFGRGHVIGPVVAESEPEARILIEAALARLDGRFVRIDTAAASGLSPWLAEIGLPQVGDALTMVRGTLPPAGRARVFALSNQSLN
ncbi:GNAT family N-acetyltransferase [Methylobacterium terricola]|uniref:GNAT family N-acetyltransferase n=2 Tax=Methylobacterium terricola TaxID=2583531 RepID=A0A5C4LQW7_9HYPH|nr:GNAT family N-acetyltransferase [Methylobacterium terricola]